MSLRVATMQHVATPNQDVLRALIELAAGRPADLARPGLVEAAQAHRVLPLLSAQLWQVPNVDRAELAAQEMEARARFRAVRARLDDVVRVGGLEGVEVLILKGIPNAERWFVADPEARTCSDVDVWFNPNCPRDLGSVLRGLEPHHPLAACGEELLRKGVITDLAVRNGVLVELHALPMALSMPTVALRALWERSEVVHSATGLPYRRLDATDATLLTLINSAKDNHAYLLQVIEVGRALADPQLEWGRLVEQVRALRWDAIVLDAVRFCCALLAIPEPDLSELRPARSAARVLHRIAPTADRLGGRSQWHRAQRFTKLELAVPGRRAVTVVGMASRAASPDAYIRAFAPDLRGPYPVRAAQFWMRRQQYVRGRRSSLGNTELTSR